MLLALREMEKRGVEATRNETGGGIHSGRTISDQKARRRRRREDPSRPQLRRSRRDRTAHGLSQAPARALSAVCIAIPANAAAACRRAR
jgi:hypothetical protein